MKTDIYEPRGGASGETNPADTLISKSSLLNCENRCLLCKPPVWGTLIPQPQLTNIRREEREEAGKAGTGLKLGSDTKDKALHFGTKQLPPLGLS